MAGFVLSARSQVKLEGVHPFLVRVAEVAITLTRQDFAVHDGVRSEAQQRAMVNSGASKTMDSKHRKQGDGMGHAIDLVPFINGQLRWEWRPIFQIAAAVQRAAAIVNVERLDAGKDAKRLRWGGVWDLNFAVLGMEPDDIEDAVNDYVARRRAAGKRVFIDGPHFEIAA
jgi:peptidoglycan L-alanyl-D-glutamate endopeptidase CwlK